MKAKFYSPTPDHGMDHGRVSQDWCYLRVDTVVVLVVSVGVDVVIVSVVVVSFT